MVVMYIQALQEGGLLKLWKKYGLVLKEGFLYFHPAGSGDPSSPKQYKFVIALNDSWKCIVAARWPLACALM